MKNDAVRSSIDRIFEHYSSQSSPGCALAVIKDSKIIFKQGYGLANLEINAPITPSSVFNIGSMAKQFTAFAIALLAADGKLSLDDDIRQYLLQMHDFGKKITIRHLIHHTSGIRDSFPALLSLAEWRDTDATTTDDVYQLLTAQRSLNFDPGEEFEYANSNYVLLAQICEQVSGQSFQAFCQERIFTPLDMQDTCVNASYFQLIPRRAPGYYEDGQGGWINAPLTDSVVGPTNIYTSVLDLAKWDQNFYTGTVGGEAIINQIQQPGQLNDGGILDYAFGVEVGPAHHHRGWHKVEHGGSQGGYSSWMVRFPDLHLSVMLLCNHFSWSTRDSVLKVADIFVCDHPTQKPEPETTVTTHDPVELRSSQLEPKSGIYFDAEHVTLRNITLSENRLQFEELDLIPLNKTTFYFEVEPQTQVVFMPTSDGGVANMKTITSSGEYRYERVEPVAPTHDDLLAYAGRYYSSELDVYWTFSPGDGNLIAHRRKYVDSQLKPLFKDTFRDDWSPLMGYPTTYIVRFTRNDLGAIVGLRVSGNGVRNIQFDRVH